LQAIEWGLKQGVVFKFLDTLNGKEIVQRWREKVVDEENSNNVLGLVKEEAEQHVQMLSKVVE